MPVQFAVLASGSRGNATLIRAGGAGVLIDLGLGPRAIAERLESVGASWGNIAAAILTHTHGDHLDNHTFRAMSRGGISLYCHDGHRDELSSHAGFQALESASLVRSYDERPFMTPTGIRFEPLELRHDGGPTFGFRIEAREQRRESPVSLGYLADTGCWSEPIVSALADVDLLGVEFNHDVELQRRSRRPMALIERNLGDWGHLSNDQGAELVAAVLSQSRPGTVRHLVLLHLSQQCNRPELALIAASHAVRSKGCRIAIHAAQQAPAHPNVWVRPGRRQGAKPLWQEMVP